MHLGACLCAMVEPLALRTRVVVIAHHIETWKTTNTGRLVPLTLVHGEVRVRGYRGMSVRIDDLVCSERQGLLLYPCDASRELRREDVEADGRPVTLVVPDGTWGQARKVATRERLHALPRVHLPPGPPSGYRLRHHPDPSHLATFEAVARALGILEGEAVQERLERVFAAMVERTLASRGGAQGARAAS